MVDAISTASPVQSLSTVKAAPERAPETEADGDAKSARSIRDTLEIGGNKIINLARAKELAAALPDATEDRDAFDAALSAAQEDVSRITHLFQSVLGDLVSLWQPDATGTGTAGARGQAQPSVQDLQQILDRALRDTRRISEQVAETLRRIAPLDIEA
jgi:hypothetical protein